jgi:hypothetical protein
VTSRERNPQFCGTPNRFRDRGFYSIQPDEFTCPESEIDLDGPIGVVDSLVPKPFSPTTAAVTFQTTVMTSVASTESSPTTLKPTTQVTTSSSTSSRVKSTTTASTTPRPTMSTTGKPIPKNSPSWRQNSQGTVSHKQRPPLVLGFPPSRGQQIDDSKEVQVKNAFR